MSLCHLGDPRYPFADLRAPTPFLLEPPPLLASVSAPATQPSSPSSPARYVRMVTAQPTRQCQVVGQRWLPTTQDGLVRTSSYSPVSSGGFYTPISQAVPAPGSPVRVEHWQIVGQRMARIFQDPGLLQSPMGSPVHKVHSYAPAVTSPQHLGRFHGASPEAPRLVGAEGSGGEVPQPPQSPMSPLPGVLMQRESQSSPAVSSPQGGGAFAVKLLYQYGIMT